MEILAQLRHLTLFSRFSIIILSMQLLFFALPAQASTILTLTDQQQVYNPTRYFDILEDKENRYTIDEITTTPLRNRFVENRKEVLNFGFSPVTYWIRIEIANHSAKEKWFLFHYPSMADTIDSIRLFVSKANGGFSEFKSGENGFEQDSDEMDLASSPSFYPISIPNGQRKTLYIRLQDKSLVFFHVDLYNNQSIRSLSDFWEILVFVYGAFGFFLVFNFLLFLSLKDKLFLYYDLVLLGYFTRMLLSIVEKWIPHLSSIKTDLVGVSYLLIGVSWLLLTQQFFNTRKLAPRLNRVFLIMIGIYGVLIPVHAVFPLHIVSRFASYFYLFASVFLISVSIFFWRRRFIGARYYVVSIIWLFLLSGALQLSVLDIITINFWQGTKLYLVHIVSMLMIFSFVLIDRYNLLKKEMLAKQERALISMQKAEKLKDEFLANTSHELRTPLHGIIGLCEDLKDRGSDKQDPGYVRELDLIIRSGRRLAVLIDDILDLSRIKQNELRITPKAIDFKSAVSVAVAVTKPMIGQKNIKLVCNIADDLPPVMADENRTQQILLNLLGNAIKFTHEGRVEISADAGEAFLKVSVTDTGIGISRERQDDIFKQFSQIDAAVNREYGGTGLGLAISRRLVEMHGGTIGVTSDGTSGSTFYFTLPLARGQEMATFEEMQVAADLQPVVQETVIEQPFDSSALISTNIKSEKSNHKPQHVLVVDDDAVSLQTLSNHLLTAGYTVSRAQDGFQAWDIIQEQPLELVVLDIMMPRMSGYELCHKIREAYNITELPVIMLTAMTRVEDIVNGFESGANDYLTKPVNRDELLARIGTAFNLKKMADLLRDNEELKEEVLRRKRAENELLTANKRLVRLIDNWDKALLVVDRQKRIQFYNRSAENLFGHQVHQITSQPLSVLFPHDANTIIDSLSNLKRSVPSIQTATNRFYKVTAQKKDQSEFLLEVVLSPIETMGDIVFAILCRPPNSEVGSKDEHQTDLNIADELTRTHQRVNTLQGALDDVLQYLTAEGKQLVADLRRIDDSMENVFSGLGEEEVEGLFRNTVVGLMETSLDLWVQSTGKDKIQLAEESGIWAVHLDVSTYKTRTMDKYLNIEKLPKNPRWRDVMKTAEFVSQACIDTNINTKELEALMVKLTSLIKVRRK